MNIQVRRALLDDSAAISALFRSHIYTWQRLNTRGLAEDVAYSQLTLHERWLHGGPCMSIETCAIHLAHLLLGAGIPLVAEQDGQIAAYAEAYLNNEPAPYGQHLSLAEIVVGHPHTSVQTELEDALLAALLAEAKKLKIQRLTVHSSQPTPIIERHGFIPLTVVARYSLPARTGQVFYKSVDHPNPDASQIASLMMPSGRLASPRQQWETYWPPTWQVIPEIAAQRVHRLRFSAAGQDAFLFIQQQPFDARAAWIYAWSSKALTGQYLTALRDWAHREGYRILIMIVSEEAAKTLGSEAEPDGYRQHVYVLDVV